MTLRAPPEWVVGDPGDAALALSAPPRGGSGLSDSVRVRVLSLPKRPPLGVIADAVVADLQVLPEFRVASRELNVTVAGLPAARLSYTFKPPGSSDTLQSLHVLAQDGDTVYAVIFATGEPMFADARPTFDRIAGTLQVRK